MKRFSILLPMVLLCACNGFKSVKGVFRDIPPYERYLDALRKADLTNASMTRDWLSAGERIFSDSIFVDAPFSEAGFFQASHPEARGYRFRARDGQVLTVECAVKTSGDARVFMDLFKRDENDWKHIAYSDSTLSLTYEFKSDEECLLRLQPELLANVWYSIQLALTPVLINPVYGASNKSIGSFYGAPRDNGKRLHEGVDIFAPKGTPVVAPAEGFITRVGTSGLGGKVVWMKDIARQHSYYFAHLDSQMVKPGMRVRQGHVLGLVGNTGNAKYTPPHLHFGIYQSGSKDPLHYIRKAEAAVRTVPIDTGFHQKPFKTRLNKSALRFSPSQASPVKATLEKGTYVVVKAQSHDWYRIALPNEIEGYISKKQVLPLAKGTLATLDSVALLVSGVHRDAVPIAELAPGAEIEILARFEKHTFVLTSNGKAGWLAKPI